MESRKISERINKNVNLICKLFEKFGKKKYISTKDVAYLSVYNR